MKLEKEDVAFYGYNEKPAKVSGQILAETNPLVRIAEALETIATSLSKNK